MRIAVLGAGAWGTAFAVHGAARAEVSLWTRHPEHAERMRQDGCNAQYLPGIPLGAIDIEDDLSACARVADLWVIATPSAGLRATLRALRAAGLARPFVWLCKGFEAGSGKLAHQVVEEEWSDTSPYGALSGPSFALEVARGLPTAVTLASHDAEFARATAQALHSQRLRIYTSADLMGVEVGGAAKNVLAIAAGISDGLGFGLNARAALITRGLAEMTRLGLKMGGQMETFMGLSGVGDLILTCTGDLSRNRRVGTLLARGLGIEAILRELGHVAEGVSTAHEIGALAEHLGVDMPITQAVRRILVGDLPARQAVEALLNREQKAEGIL
jgi:glycerol-3-phosphate dehydrogenase (NAD(P)+)